MAYSFWQRTKHSELLTIGNRRYAICFSFQTGDERRFTSDGTYEYPSWARHCSHSRPGMIVVPTRQVPA
ncbi:MAG: hypothetical protein EWM72_02626 [Nitrospira sp.]|nr:MAG: hypothetical protein EWM72_02626 [Nitrospira sp.]